MKGLIEIYCRCASISAKKRTQNRPSLWAITMPVGFVSIVWICATTAHQMDSGRLVIDLEVKDYVQIRADIDKRPNEFSKSPAFE